VPDYADEDGVDPARGTETYAEVLLELDDARWSGTRFRLRAGKALAARRKGIEIRFHPPGDAGGSGETPSTAPRMWIGVDGPDDIGLELVGRAAGGTRPGRVPVRLTGQPPASDLPPYARVLLDVLGGGSTLSVRGDEAEQAWQVVTPVLAAWADGEPPLLDYPAGSSGPPPLAGSGPSGRG
jgi:glucose-6-phosphate 1-dehydrogenase